MNLPAATCDRNALTCNKINMLMKTLLPLAAFLLFHIALLGQKTWTGANSIIWDDPGNWSPAGTPGSGENVTFLIGPTNQLVLETNVSGIGVLEVRSGAVINLNGQVISGEEFLVLGGGTVETNSRAIIGFQRLRLNGGTFNGPMTFQKTGNPTPAGNNSISQGGNTFNGNMIVESVGLSVLRFANVNGDIFNGPVTFRRFAIALPGFTLIGGPMEIASNGTTQFRGNVTVEDNSTETQGIKIGGSIPGFTGSAEIEDGSALLSASFDTQPLTLTNVTQDGTAPNGNFQPITLTVTDCSFGGDFSATNVEDINISGSTFAADNTFSAQDFGVVENSNFSTVSGSTSFTKQANPDPMGVNTNDRFFGGNTYGEVTFTNNGPGTTIFLADMAPDRFEGDATFIAGSGTSIRPAFSGDNVFLGDISLLGNQSEVRFGDVGGGRVVIEGDTPQQLLGTTSTVIARLLMNSQPGGSFTLDDQVRINGDLTLTSGVLFAPVLGPNPETDFSLDLLTGATISGGSAASYVDGLIRKQYGMTPPPSFVFPVGTDGIYAPVTITAPTSGNFVQYFRGVPPSNTSVAAPLDHVSGVEWWTVLGSAASTLTLTWDSPRSGGVDNLPDLRIARLNESISTWEDQGGTASGNTTSGTITAPLTAFGEYTLASVTVLNPLPVELLHFTAEPAGDEVALDWATASEVGHAAFVIERSGDGKVFDYLAKIEGDGQDRYEEKQYQHMDQRPLAGTSYYRLKQIDLDGTVTYSDIVSVTMEGVKGGDVTLFPNPAREWVTVSSNERLVDPEILLFNTAGQRVPLQYTADEFQIELPVQQLPAGIYFLRLQNGTSLTTQQLVIER